MIGALSGVVSEIGQDDIIINVNGVGYLVTVSRSVIDGCKGVGSPVAVVVYTEAREYAICLYGFSEKVEKEVFLLLKKVKGVGSKIALGILNALGAEVILASIGSGDASALQRVSGVGKKTAARIIVELGEHVCALASSESFCRDVSRGDVSSSDEVGDEKGKKHNYSIGASYMMRASEKMDTLLALEKLGVFGERAERSVNMAVEVLGNKASASDLLKTALANL